MKARAPGKVVLSGAYAVLEGAPALVTAVDRYVIANTSVAATFEAPEARAAIPHGALPHVDVSALRRGDRKLGLGSSAAGVVASLAAVLLDQEPDLDAQGLARRVWRPALLAHRKAQGGGSGIDVVTSAMGATRSCWLRDGEVFHERHKLPPGLTVDLYAARESTSTPHMLSLVRTWKNHHPKAYNQTMDALVDASRRASNASTIEDLVRAIGEQRAALTSLGDRSGAPIVPPPLRDLATRALEQGVAIHPSGAGGGDIVLCMGDAEGCQRWTDALESLGLERLDAGVEALGVHPFPSPSPS